MIELTKLNGTKVSINTQGIVSISVGEFEGTRIALTGGWIYYVKEPYEEVLDKIRGRKWETKS